MLYDIAMPKFNIEIYLNGTNIPNLKLFFFNIIAVKVALF